MKFRLLLCLLFVWNFSSVALAQLLPAGSEPGQVEKRFEQTSQPRSLPKITRGLESTTAPEIAAGTNLVLRSIKLTHSTIYSDEDIRELFEPLIGKSISLSQVFTIAARITAKYGEEGYLLSRVIVPPQELEPSGAHITLQAVEGYISEVVWPDEVAEYKDFFSEYSDKITAQRPINRSVLERYLLLAGDLPGLTFGSTLKESISDPVSSVLQVTIDENKYSSSVSVNNYGTETSGPYQSTIQVSANNTAYIHERISGGYTAVGFADHTNDLELSYLFFNYKQVLNSEGLNIEVSGNASWGDPGTKSLRAVNFETESLNLSAVLSSPIIRSRAKNLTGTLAFDYKNSKSINLGNTASEDRLRIIRGKLEYDFADSIGATNQFIGTLYKGIDGLGSTTNNNPNASRTPGHVDFFKATLEASRRQKLPQKLSLNTNIFGQWTNDPLLSSQECGYGGQKFGRGFDASVIVGDRCFLASAELQRNLQVPPSLSKMQLYGFIDYGYIQNIDAPLGTSDNDSAASAGLGLRFGKENWSADVTLAAPIVRPNSTITVDDYKSLFKLTIQY